MKKGKIFNIILISISVALFLAAAVFVILLNIPPVYPSAVEIIENNGKIYVQTSKNESGYGYIFRFVSENDTLNIPSDLNILDISELYHQHKEIVIGREYDISVSHRGEISGGDSPFSPPVKWVAKTYLQAPTLSESEGLLQWEQVPLADRYRIYYSDKDVRLVAETAQTSYELKNLVGGVHNIFITAISSSEYRMESAPSNVLEGVSVVHEISPLRSASYSKATGMLSIYSNEELTSLKLVSNDETHVIRRLQFSQVGSIYFCTIDISFKAGENMQVCPYPEDDYNVYTGNMTQISIN